MNIFYSEADKSNLIKDGVKTQYMALRFLLILILLNAIINLYGISFSNLSFMSVIWLVLGIISAVASYIYFFKTSASNKIAVSAIKALKYNVVSGNKRFYFLLHNGKKRHLVDVKTEAQIKEIKQLCSNCGISNII